MELRDYFLEIARNYRAEDGLDTAAQVLLRQAGEHLRERVPAGFAIQGSGGKGRATFTPWVGIFDPDETDSPQRGIYVVYLFSEDLSSLALSLNQGIEFLRRDLGDADARRKLAGDAEAVRRFVGVQTLQPFNDPLDLRSSGARQKAYEAGNIACRMYSTASLPTEPELQSDLDQLIAHYERAVEAKRNLLLSEPGSIATPSGGARRRRRDPLDDFRPKSDEEYRAQLKGRQLVKSRRHETLLNAYARWASERGFLTSSPHPEDLMLRMRSSSYLVEAKTVRNGNATEAVRAAVGQLTMYSHFLHPGGGKPALVALFSEDVGSAYREFLEELSIATVWWERGAWSGSPSAVAHGLATTD